ncbi:hypothetical protein GC163_00745 [bacterium]|nr:hypothetical protein [bacterium]
MPFPWTGRVIALVTVLALADLLKHLALMAAGQVQPWGDSTVYWRMADAVAQGDWWLAEHPVAYRTPGYPWFLGLIRSLTGEHALFVTVIVQHLCVWLTSLVTAAMTWQMTRSVRAMGFAWAVCVCSTARPLYANWLLTESLATFLLVLTCWLSLLAWHCGCWKRWMFAGFVLGCGVLVRPSLLAAFPAMLILELWSARKSHSGWPCRILVATAAPVMFSLTLLPWCLRNQLLFERFSLVVFTGRELWTANFSPWPGAHLDDPETSAAREVHQRIGAAPIDWRHNWSTARALAESGLNDVAVDELMEHMARDAIARQPWRAAGCTFARCATFWYCWEWPTDLIEEPADIRAQRVYADQYRWQSPGWTRTMMALMEWTPERQRFTSLLGILLAGTGLIWLVALPATRPAGVYIALILLATTFLTATLEIPLYRYRCGLEPLLIVAAVAGLWVRLASRSTIRLP